MKAGTVAEVYWNKYAGECRRWWLDERVLIGGSLQDVDDFARLQERGVTHVLSVESEGTDDGLVPADRLLYLPCDDDGRPRSPASLSAAAHWGRRVLEASDTVLYVHCQVGKSRSPTYGYAVVRFTYGVTRAEFLRRARMVYPAWGDLPHHEVYMNSVESAVDLYS